MSSIGTSAKASSTNFACDFIFQKTANGGQRRDPAPASIVACFQCGRSRGELKPIIQWQTARQSKRIRTVKNIAATSGVHSFYLECRLMSGGCESRAKNPAAVSAAG